MSQQQQQQKKQQQSKKHERSPRFGGKPQAWQKKGNNNNSSSSSKKRPPLSGNAAPIKQRAAPEDNVRYTVIITNVENDFGKLHNASLPYYCGLRGEFEATLDVERLVNSADRADAQRLTAATRGCAYTVRTRGETRSAEISFYGPADADFSAMQFQKQPRSVRGAAATSASASTEVVAGSSAPPSTSVDETQPPQQQQCEEDGEHEDREVDPTAHTVGGADEASEEKVGDAVPITQAASSALETLALRLRRMHYFEDKLPVHVHRPGHKAGEVLLRVGEAPATEKAKPAKAGEKRSRAEAEAQEANDSEDGVDDSMLEEEEKQEAASADDGDKQSEAHSHIKPRRPHKASRSAVVRQFPNRQKDFVTAVAALSAHVPLSVVRRRMHDLPGYLSCWSIYEKHLRVVFRDAESLFKAKQLLDQFELDAGLRVSLMLSDPLSRSHAEFVHAQEVDEAEQ